MPSSPMHPSDDATPLTGFNLRVYGLWLNSRKELLVVDEIIRGQAITKFPGGGVELGEGLEEAIHREWEEELGLPITEATHFYTTGFYQRSAFNPAHQIISVYYRVLSPEDRPFRALPPQELEIQGFSWVPWAKLRPEALTLPIDQHVVSLLQQTLG